MANCLSSLQEELERTKRELQELKLERESEKQMMEFEIEHLKFVEDPPNSEMTRLPQVSRSQGEEEANEFQKKRYVTFANSPVSHVPPCDVAYYSSIRERNCLRNFGTLLASKAITMPIRR